MPTTRPRHAITETDDIAAALATARRTWPHLADKPGELLRQLIITGEHAISDNSRERLDAIAATSGALTDAFPAGYLDELREDWSE